jgi:hypothetical protein
MINFLMDKCLLILKKDILHKEQFYFKFSVDIIKIYQINKNAL